MQPDNLNVFDFDGTLVGINSFREINKRLVMTLLKKRKIMPFLTMAVLYAVRKSEVLSHVAFKQRVVNIFEKSLTESEKINICQSVFENNLNKTVLERMLKLDNCIVCTAAPFAYMSRLSLIKKVPVISSLDSESRLPYKDNSGPAKAENLKAYFKGKYVHVANFFTDNTIDDQALIDISDNAYVVQGDRFIKVK